ncbi:MAG: glycosyl transferase [Spirosomataceae bacterium]
MRLVFTICTLSHLAQAKTMADSLLKHNPDYQVVIGLFDKVSNRDVSSVKNYTLVEINDTQIPDFEQLFSRYTPFELSCLAKPYLANWLLKHYPKVQKLLYFDSDILFFNSVASIEEDLEKYPIVLTPHVTQPLVGTGTPHLRNFLNAGLYNGGFFAIKREKEALDFLNWWQERVWQEGYLNFAEGMFVDQLWLNYVPLFYPNTLISGNVGYNLAYWNMHERKVSQKGEQFWVNNHTPLLFFHFSGYSLAHANQLSVHQDRYSFENRPDIKPLYDIYKQLLQENNDTQFKTLPNAYHKPTYFYQKSKAIRRVLIAACRRILRLLNA